MKNQRQEGLMKAIFKYTAGKVTIGLIPENHEEGLLLGIFSDQADDGKHLFVVSTTRTSQDDSVKNFEIGYEKSKTDS